MPAKWSGKTANDEADAHDQTTDHTGGQIGRIDPDLPKIDHAESDRAEQQNHGHGNGGEHHLEYGQFPKIELTGELSGIAEPGAFERVAKGHADCTEQHIGPGIGSADCGECVERKVHERLLNGRQFDHYGTPGHHRISEKQSFSAKNAKDAKERQDRSNKPLPIGRMDSWLTLISLSLRSLRPLRTKNRPGPSPTV